MREGGPATVAPAEHCWGCCGRTTGASDSSTCSSASRYLTKQYSSLRLWWKNSSTECRPIKRVRPSTTTTQDMWTWKRRPPKAISQPPSGTHVHTSPRAPTAAYPLVSSFASSQTGGRILLTKSGPFRSVQRLHGREGVCHVWAAWRFCRGLWVARPGQASL